VATVNPPVLVALLFMTATANLGAHSKVKPDGDTS
jgi:hypothetical protein